MFGDGLAQFADLKDGMLVEVAAVTQTDGTLLATDVEMMEASNGMEADGIVIATTGSPVTSLNMLVQDDTENVAANMLGTTLSVDVSNAMFKSPPLFGCQTGRTASRIIVPRIISCQL